jgi:hypothetical protein
VGGERQFPVPRRRSGPARRQGAGGRERARAVRRAEAGLELRRQGLGGGLALGLALHRTLEDGEIRERFRALRPREGAVPGTDRRHAYARTSG